MKKLTAVILTVAMVISCFAMTAAAAGTVNVPSDLQVGVQGEGFADNITISAGTAVNLQATIDMAPVRAEFEKQYQDMADTLTDPAMLAKFRSCKMTGTWTWILTCPEATVLPETVLNATDLAGFNDDARLIFKEKSRTQKRENGNLVFTIETEIAGLADGEGNRPGFCTVGDMKDHLSTWLGDMQFNISGIKVSAAEGTTFLGSMTGSTNIKANVLSESFAFTSVPKNTQKGAIRAYVTIQTSDEGEIGYKGGSSSGGKNLPITSKNPGEESDSSQGKRGTASSDVSGLDSKNHMAYVEGDGDGMIRPNDSISRAEVTTMLYRLLDASRRDEIFTDTYRFADLSKDLWYNKAVASMAQGGYVTGYEDGNFYGDNAITRAEMVAMVTRFAAAKTGTVNFADVDGGYWAHDAIATAVANNWVSGYPDSTFRPDQYITRAESMAIINRVLGRGVSEEGLHENVYKNWADNADPNEWYYYEIIEAGNSHNYTGARPSEVWSGMAAVPYYDIEHYERP